MLRTEELEIGERCLDLDGDVAKGGLRERAACSALRITLYLGEGTPQPGPGGNAFTYINWRVGLELWWQNLAIHADTGPDRGNHSKGIGHGTRTLSQPY